MVLYIEIMADIRAEFKFQDYFIWKAEGVFQYQRKLSSKELIFVGVHARRGDHLSSWMQKFPDSQVGKFEGKYFNHAMDLFRNKYNTNTTKVIFVATSDDINWIKLNFNNPGDIIYTADLVTGSDKEHVRNHQSKLELSYAMLRSGLAIINCLIE